MVGWGGFWGEVAVEERLRAAAAQALCTTNETRRVPPPVSAGIGQPSSRMFDGVVTSADARLAAAGVAETRLPRRRLAFAMREARGSLPSRDTIYASTCA